MSRQRDKIQKAATRLGFGKVKMLYEPIGIALEMCGHTGGWEVRTKDGQEFLGYNADEVIADMEISKRIWPQQPALAESPQPAQRGQGESR